MKVKANINEIKVKVKEVVELEDTLSKKLTLVLEVKDLDYKDSFISFTAEDVITIKSNKFSQRVKSKNNFKGKYAKVLSGLKLSYFITQDVSEEIMLESAKNFSIGFHKNQVDKGGNDYFQSHIMAIVNSLEEPKEKILAYLHDILEDTACSMYDLTPYFAQEILDALDVITKKKKQSYESYLKKLKSNELAKKVKIEDLENDLDLSRLKEVTEKDLKRIEKYKSALEFLKEKERKKN